MRSIEIKHPTVRQNFCTFNFFSVGCEDFAVAGRDFPHPELRFNGSGKQHVGSVVPEHALQKQIKSTSEYRTPEYAFI